MNNPRDFGGTKVLWYMRPGERLYDERAYVEAEAPAAYAASKARSMGYTKEQAAIIERVEAMRAKAMNDVARCDALLEVLLK